MKSEAKDAATFKRLEARLQLPSVRTSRQQLGLLLADAFVEFGSSGATHDKRSVIAGLLADPESALPRYATMENLKVRRLADDVRLVTYRSRKTRPGTTVPERANRSSIWQKIDGRWQMLFHQGTPLARPPVKKKRGQ
jgi:hypothetical protein